MNDELWKKITGDLEVNLSASAFSMWIKTTTFLSISESSDENEPDTLTLGAINHYHQKILLDKHSEDIRKAYARVSSRQAQLLVEVVASSKRSAMSGRIGGKSVDPNQTPLFDSVDSSTQESQGSRSSNDETNKDGEWEQRRSTGVGADQQHNGNPAVSGMITRAGLREDYTFENFAVSTSNEMAHAAAMAVSQNPGKAYNPLFLYGGVGVGKTHLMQAIGHNILNKDPTAALVYVTGEQITNEIIAAIQQKRMIQLKQRLRSYRILLVDDAQFIAGKTAVQEEFFHTFNAIAPGGGQIILTSDRPPHEINLLEDRLRSRFEAGLIIDIQQPTFELRTAILLIKAEKIGLQLPMDLAQKIASAVESTRKLEGTLTRLHSAHTLFKKPITMELVNEILGSVQPAPFAANTIRPQEVLKAISAQFRIPAQSIKGPSRSRPLVRARHIAMYVLHRDLNITLEEIGRMFGGRDHTSVLHAVGKIENLLTSDDELKNHLDALKTSLSFPQQRG